MSNYTESSSTVTISVLFFVFWELLNVSATCNSPQYAEYGQQGVIKCDFMSGFTGIYWYSSVNSGLQIVIRLEQRGGALVASGDGYSDGKYNIHPDGSLVISNVTNYNNQTYKVVHVDKEMFVEELYIELVTAILPDSKFPVINVCNEKNLCLMEKVESMLTCSYKRSKPLVELAWYRHSHEGTYRLHGKSIVKNDGDLTFSSVSTTNISNLINGPLIAFSCHISNPVLSIQDMDSTVVVDTTTQAWPSMLENVKKEKWVLVNSKVEIPCHGTKRPFIFVWKRIRRNTANILMFATIETERFFSNADNGNWNVSYDGSMVSSSIRFEDEGLYTCIFFDGSRYVSSTMQVNIWVKPSPPSIFTERCPHNEEPCEVIVKERNAPFKISCLLIGVYPNVTLVMNTDFHSDTQIIKRNMYSARRGNVFDITTIAEFSPIDCDTQINVTCYLPLPLIEGKVISVRSEKCEATRSSAAVAVISATIAILILIICGLLVLRFRGRFLRKTDTEEASSHEVESLNNIAESFTLVKNCEETADTLLLWPVYPSTEIFKESILEAFQVINNKKQTDTSSSARLHKTYLDNFYDWSSWLFKLPFSFYSPTLDQDNQTDNKRNKDQQLLDEFKLALNTFVHVQKDLLYITASLAISCDIIKAVSNNSNFSDDKYTSTDLNDSKNFLKALKNELKDNEDHNLPTILSKLDQHIIKFLKVLQTYFLQSEERSVSGKIGYQDCIHQRKNIVFGDLPWVLDTLLKKRKDIVDSMDIFHFIIKFYIQSLSQEDSEVTTLQQMQIEGCKGEIKARIETIAEGVNAAATELRAIGQNVDVAFLGSMESSFYMNKEEAVKMNVAMIETMKKMNAIARSLQSLS